VAARFLAIVQPMLALLVLTISAPAWSAAAGAGDAAAVSVGMPSDFEALARDQRVVADFFFGGEPIGQFEVESTSGTFRIVHPDKVLTAIPHVLEPNLVAAALARPLDNNAHYLCSAPNAPCGHPTPDVVAGVFDQQRFRIDLFLNPKLLAVRMATADLFLRPTIKGPTLVDTIAGAVVGGTEGPAVYNIRNRAVLGAGAFRLLSETSFSSNRSLDVDVMAAQVDRPNLRYTAGLYYVPGADLVGQRRIMGAGISSQFDTRADRTVLTGSPLIVFLNQRSRVDLYSGGRLIGSHVYDAGNQALDTSSLPDGAYPVEIHIQEESGATRVETSFFTKSAAIPPPGRTILFVNAGLIVADRNHPLVDLTRVPLLVAGAARRAGAHFAWDFAAMVTNRKGLTEAGLSFLSEPVQARIAVLGSTKGDYGFVAQAASTSLGRISYNLDVRHVHSHDGSSLIPVDDYHAAAIATSDVAAQQAQTLSRTFTQMFANLSYRIRQAQIGASASVQRMANGTIHYAVGPTVRWPILQRDRLQLSVDASYAATDRGRSFAAGLRLQVFARRSSLSAVVGAQSGLGEKGTGGIVDVGGSVQRDHVLGGQLSASGDVQSNSKTTLVRASADSRGPIGYGSASVIQRIDGSNSSTQFSLALQSSIAANREAIRFGARDQNDSVISVRLSGKAADVRFEVLVDETPAGVVAPGKHVTIAVPPYRRYVVRLRPIGTKLVSFDAKARIVDVYPGSFASLDWKVDEVLAMFGRIVRPDGSLIATADVTTVGAIAATDERGYFQIQAAPNAVLTVRQADGTVCKAALAAVPSDKGYTAVGDVTCRS
jgi:hypothetical protein